MLAKLFITPKQIQIGGVSLAARIRRYFDDVPEDVKEHLSRDWGNRKGETFVGAERNGLEISQGDSFNRVVTFTLEPGLYKFQSRVVSVSDVADYGPLGQRVRGLIEEMASKDRILLCTPLIASNICDWDSAYAKSVDADKALREAIISGCVANGIVLAGGETANLGDQVRKTGMSWTFTLLSRYEGKRIPRQGTTFTNPFDVELQSTFGHLADKSRYEIVNVQGVPMLHVKKAAQFVITADGTGSKSMVCAKGSDIKDTLAMAGDDATREGAFPVVASISIHAENENGQAQMSQYMRDAGRAYEIPLIGSTFHVSPDVYTYTSNGAILSEVRRTGAQTGQEVRPGLSLVVVAEEQRSNGITMQRNVFAETFGTEWYRMPANEALQRLVERLDVNYPAYLERERRTLGELVAKPSTPYFRVDSKMPGELRETISFTVNISSGGIIGKTRRTLEPFGIGAFYSDLFDMPALPLLLQMASRLPKSVGVIDDLHAYYTWGCGTGQVVATTEPGSVIYYYQEESQKHGREEAITARIGGVTTDRPEIRLLSRGLDSYQAPHNEPLIIVHKHSDPAEG
jgi:hypothetical protein